MAKSPDNQGKCCDAVLRVLEKKLDAGRSSVTADGGSSGAGVDVTCLIGSQRFALEHTRLDPYSGKVGDDIHTGQCMTPIIERLDRELVLPDEAGIELVFNPLSLEGVKRSEWTTLQSRLVEWVTTAAPTLDEPEPGRFTSCAEQPAAVPFRVTLRRVRRLTEKVSFLRYQPSDLESARNVRVEKALADKLPKLAAYKRDGMFTVLVLENDDIALSNEALINASVAKGLQGSQLTPPDAIYLVETDVATLWVVVCLKYWTTTWPETAPFGGDYPTFEPDQLSDILKS